ncbi:hypothetical protein ACIG0C_33455 [Kitasatospora aureofaciens]|uniref:Uncharacterized protein n=1 Tax=Kitasatospora aureofaciens TaxID=1894 RepID=A0A1E7NEI2_KITAU|nr:hypothetical protein [Kitasatospora aureofaciens]ARF83338.1 hypothetical protein B6264_30945 [Kitasatospora aureofaciens]OEV39109.1 hypothetical protein HS99_0018670 [Kitasatospora aureofaciens]GGV04333.1 hypothetical protein GCM10010502_68790 [Kitasatospora aureofaciens]
MTPVQSVLQFLADVVASVAWPQADQLAHAVRNVGFVLSTVSAAVNALAAIRKRRTSKDPVALPVLGCCGACPAHRPQAGAE